MSTYIFGNLLENFILDELEVEKIIQIAKDKKKVFELTPIEEIINVLDCVSTAWANKNYHLRKKAYESLKNEIGYSDEMLDLAFQTISTICSKEFLNIRLKTELNSSYSKEKLDNFLLDEKSKGMLKIVPYGLILHVLASNVFILLVDSLVSGLITKNINLIKLGHLDLAFPILFAQSIKEHDPNSIIYDKFAMFYFKGGSLDIENQFSTLVDAVIVWGGSDAISSWRNKPNANCKLIEYGPKISFSLIDLNEIQSDDMLYELCNKLALDISIWEQLACSAPQNIYVIESSKYQTKNFAIALHNSLYELTKKLPTKNLKLDEQIEILKFREKYFSKFIANENCEIIFKSDGLPISVVINHENLDCEISVLFRNIIIKPISHFNQFYLAIEKIKHYLQAVSLFVNEKEFLTISQNLASIGVNRILMVGKHSEPFLGASHDGQYFLDKLVRYVTFELEFDKQNKLILNDISHDKKIALLKNIVNNALNTNYYKKIINNEILKLDNNQFYEEFLKIPLLGKNEIYSNCLPDSTNIISNNNLLDTYIFASGGTTGKPKFALYTYEELDYATYILSDIYRVAGIKSNDKVANLFIAGGLWTSFIVANKAIEKIGATCLPIGGNTSFDTILEFFKMLKPNVLIGLPSIILKFAEFCESKNVKINLDLILYGGEHLRKNSREYLSKIFDNPKIMSAGYAAVDCGPIGFQCEYLSGSLHHVLSNYQFVEFINNNGIPAKNGEVGEIVVTNLNRVRMPIIRFKTGDLGIAHTNYVCKCGRSNLVFELLGRCDDILVIGGTNLTPNDFENSISKFNELSDIFQIVAKTNTDGFDILEIFVELKEGINLDENSKLNLTNLLYNELINNSFKIKTMITSKWISEFKINIVNPNFIKRNERTQKISIIKDLRGN